MDVKNDGGPAFPGSVTITSDGFSRIVPFGGMTFRDWFAGQGLSGLLADPHVIDRQNAARAAYEFADALLAEREK